MLEAPAAEKRKVHVVVQVSDRVPAHKRCPRCARHVRHAAWDAPKDAYGDEEQPSRPQSRVRTCKSNNEDGQGDLSNEVDERMHVWQPGGSGASVGCSLPLLSLH